MQKFDVIVIGAGAAGLFCAIEAGKRGRKVLVLEHNAQVGRKIIISGGGRCNFTNIHTKPENFISQNPHFCKSALARYTPQNFVELVKRHHIEFYEKKLGQLFCRESSNQIVEMLLDECRKARVEIRSNCLVKNVSKNDLFEVETNQGKFICESLVIATGGLSIPQLGATDFGYRIAKQFGLKIFETRPALVPFVFQNDFPESFKKLAGVSLDANISFGKASFRENILFTHKGLSGPTVLQISSYWKRGESVEIDLLPTKNALEILQNSRENKKELANFLSEFLPNRFASVFGETIVKSKPLKNYSESELANIAEKLHAWQIPFSETEGYKKAEVTLGGVSTDELSSKTMESKRVKGLYFIGEVVDVTGWLGGYNFQWAWSSGFAAGQFV
ncbi:MAG: NAD(P)/FAD-dependent oxidoreductase [Acidobacteria bacterium]|jgi:predicted Rossmann fold flavoprotein|nr:NAD(P)/FAD-dependent oxidoreductase [Acidobacteriota bacterium]